MRKQPVGVVFVLERIQPRQLPFTVPPRRPFVAVPVVDVDFNVGRVGAARLHEHAARVAADLGSGGGEGIVWEADIEESVGLGKMGC